MDFNTTSDLVRLCSTGSNIPTAQRTLCSSVRRRVYDGKQRTHRLVTAVGHPAMSGEIAGTYLFESGDTEWTGQRLSAWARKVSSVSHGD